MAAILLPATVKPNTTRPRSAGAGRLARRAVLHHGPGSSHDLVVADMMFGRGASARDRVIIRSKIAALARKGLGGWFRIAKNAVRYQLRVQERPIPMAAWAAVLARAGFADVTATRIVAEAGLVTGERPGS
jgi:hypothetical protein